MRMNSAMKHFVREVGEHERRGKGQTRERGRDGDRDGREDAHEEHASKCFSYCRRKVVAFRVMPRVLFVERRGAPNASAMSCPAVNDVFEEAPRQDTQEACADRGANHDAVFTEPNMPPRAKHITSILEVQAEFWAFFAALIVDGSS